MSAELGLLYSCISHKASQGQLSSLLAVCGACVPIQAPELDA